MRHRVRLCWVPWTPSLHRAAQVAKLRQCPGSPGPAPLGSGRGWASVCWSHGSGTSAGPAQPPLLERRELPRPGAGDTRGHTHTHARVLTPARTSICRMASSRSRMASRSSSVISGSSACPWACHTPSPPLKIFSSSDSSANGAWGLCRDTDQGYPHAQPAATRPSSQQAPRSAQPAALKGRAPPCHSRDVPTGSPVLGLP